MIQNLFSLPILKINLKKEITNWIDLENIVNAEYKNIYVNSPLEINGGISTYSVNNKLHENDQLKELNDIVLTYVKIYWKLFNIHHGLYPEINECWTNKHFYKSYTSLHSHALYPTVCTFYLKKPFDSGNIIFLNPMEYILQNIPFDTKLDKNIENIVFLDEGDLLIFPGWLKHKTEESFSHSERIVVSFNIKYTGNYLDSNTKFVDINNLKINDFFVDNNGNKVAENSTVESLFNKICIQEFLIQEMQKIIESKL